MTGSVVPRSRPRAQAYLHFGQEVSEKAPLAGCPGPGARRGEALLVQRQPAGQAKGRRPGLRFRPGCGTLGSRLAG
ncbi:MAG: hypothetical protein Q8R92_03445, partial [Deltaproteobacteria bacterium]|nr:hypothetical protein [Deltaproteobacteria bacterium]